MRTGIALVLGVLVLTGVEARPAFSAMDEAKILLAADESATSKDTYQPRARQTLDLWQKKITEFGQAAKAKGDEAGKEAGESLNHAWDDMKDRWQELHAASADGWDRARMAFEKATARMQTAWQRVTTKSE